jgi:hypothetical protein
MKGPDAHAAVRRCCAVVVLVAVALVVAPAQWLASQVKATYRPGRTGRCHRDGLERLGRAGAGVVNRAGRSAGQPAGTAVLALSPWSLLGGQFGC